MLPTNKHYLVLLNVMKKCEKYKKVRKAYTTIEGKNYTKRLVAFNSVCQRSNK